MRNQNLKKYLPQVDALITRAEKEGFAALNRNIVKKAVSNLIDKQRKSVLSGIFTNGEDLFSDKNFKSALKKEIENLKRPCFVKIINATGTVIHTNMGRAPLSDKIIKEIIPLLCNYSNLEFDLKTGKRGSRQMHAKPDLFSARDILIVNNNAAACLLVINTFARGKEVIVSRGELVEIGGSFRVPEIMESSGAILKEVGTTNKTHLQDYARAMNDKTGLILKVHRSNFIQKGFIKEVSSAELVELGKKNAVPFYYDAGSGAIAAVRTLCLNEPVIEEEEKKGVDIISFSADKLLGGTQAGIIVGKTGFIDSIKKNPLYRALRPDKFTLYYLERLFFYLSMKEYDTAPVIKMLMENQGAVKERAKKVLNIVERFVPEKAIALEKDKSMPGGGSLPEVYLDSYVLKIKHPEHSSESVKQFFLSLDPPVAIRQKDGFCVLDLRTVGDSEIKILADSIKKLFSLKPACGK
jgi:L-seryl-tRNA(Ser) seleniumtransferase